MQKTDFPFGTKSHDDASTDNSAEIIREYAKFRYNQQNQSLKRESILKEDRFRGSNNE